MKSEPRRAIGYRRGTVSTLWLKTSGRASITFASGISCPRKSGVSTSTAQPGARRRIARIVSTNAPAPSSGRSSRSTDVTTQWRSPICFDGDRDPQRLRAVDQVGLPVLHVAKAAAARADVAEDHEGGGAALPALADVGAVRLLADGVQALLARSVASRCR